MPVLAEALLPEEEKILSAQLAGRFQKYTSRIARGVSANSVVTSQVIRNHVLVDLVTIYGASLIGLGSSERALLEQIGKASPLITILDFPTMLFTNGGPHCRVRNGESCRSLPIEAPEHLQRSSPESQLTHSAWAMGRGLKPGVAVSKSKSLHCLN